MNIIIKLLCHCFACIRSFVAYIRCCVSTSSIRSITYDDILKLNNGSLLYKYLNKDLFDKLINIKSNKGFTLSDLLLLDKECSNLNINVIACDGDCYEKFNDLFKLIIHDYHNYNYDDDKNNDHHNYNYKDIIFDDSYKALFEKYIISTRVRTCRNLSEFPLTPGLNNENRQKIEEIFKNVFNDLNHPDLNFQGKYYNIKELIILKNNNIDIKQGIMFQIPFNNLLTYSGAANDYPNNRGIFFNDNMSIWINEEDHCRIMCITDGYNIVKTFKTFSELLQKIEDSINKQNYTFLFNKKYGYLTTCPTNIGTGLRASFMIRLPQLSKHTELLKIVCKKLDLQFRGSSGEHSDILTNIDISNKQRIGFTEVELIQKLINGTFKLLKLEELLTDNNEITSE